MRDEQPVRQYQKANPQQAVISSISTVAQVSIKLLKQKAGGSENVITKFPSSSS